MTSSARIAFRLFIGAPVFGLALVAILAVMTMRSGDPGLYPPGDAEPHYYAALADHGIHTGLVLARADLAEVAAATNDPVLAALAARFAAYDYVEIGWGDETFYRFAPTLSDISIRMGLNALLGLNGSTVLHVAGFEEDAARTFPNSGIVDLQLSGRGYRRLARLLSDTFAVDPKGGLVDLGQGIYGPSLFYQARGSYSLLNTCNRWISDLLHAAGVATSPVSAVLSSSLLAEIRWRNVVPDRADWTRTRENATEAP